MDAIVVQDAYKKFGKPADPFWKRFLRNGRVNGSNGNGNNNSQDKQASHSLSNEQASIKPGTSSKPANGTTATQKYTVAVDHISFTVKKGEIFGVLGPNGGGKSTLIRLIATLLLPDAGSIQVLGYDVVKQPLRVQERINRVSVEASFFKKLSPMENLIYGARLYGMNSRETRKKVVEILTRLGLEKRSIYSPMEEMSRGMQQKVAIARALLSKPELLLLDEPTTGLDPRSKREVQAVVRDLRDEFRTTILLTTHDMIEADNLCDRIAIMNNGKIIALDTPSGLKAMISPKDLKETTLEDVFLELTGKALVNAEEGEAL
jgi:ABC-2 type transport system ATP-binding protein